MRILIIGASGMLGGEFPPLLAPRHAALTPSHADCDITDEASVRRYFAESKPELAINCAAYSDVDGCERDPERAMAVNVRGAGNLARAAEQIGARLFHISTDYVFDGAKREPYTEQDATTPISVYGRSKLEGERGVLYGPASPSPHLVIRTSWLYGRYRTNFVDQTVENARAGKPIMAVAEQVSCPTWTLHLAQRIIELAELAEGAGTRATGVLHLAGAGACSRHELARTIISKLASNGKTPPAEVIATTWEKLNRPARRPVYTAMSSSRLAALGLAPLPDWKEALYEYLRLRHSVGVKK
jgi:dTDP-4-dehydrorhamnose reductase